MTKGADALLISEELTLDSSIGGVTFDGAESTFDGAASSSDGATSSSSDGAGSSFSSSVGARFVDGVGEGEGGGVLDDWRETDFSDRKIRANVILESS